MKTEKDDLDYFRKKIEMSRAGPSLDKAIKQFELAYECYKIYNQKRNKNETKPIQER
jgi:hypothetical protein